MTAPATRLTATALACAVVVALMLHVLMLAGVSAGHAPRSDMGSMTDAAGDSPYASAPQPAPPAQALHLMAGCLAVLTALAVLFRVTASALRDSAPSHGTRGRADAFLWPSAEDLPTPDSLVRAGVLLRV